MKLEVRRRKPRIEIVPMIDVMFFMLVFFMLFSTFKESQTGVDVELPKTVHLGQTKQNTVVISITKDAQVYFGDKQVTLTELGALVSRELHRDSESRFVIKPDAAVPYADLIKVMDTLAGQGVKQPLLGVDRRRIPKTTLETQMERTGDDGI